MTSREIVLGVVAVVVGFILGFFTATALRQTPGPTQTAQVGTAPEQSELPQDHPSMEQIRKLQELQQIAAANPQDRPVRVQLGNIYYDMRRFDAAILWYEEAVRLDPSDPNVTTDLGTSYLYSGNPTRAIELYNKSLSLDPKHAQTLQNLGFAQFSTTDFRGAIKSWESLLKLHPEYTHKEEIQKQIEAAKAHLKAGPPAKREQPVGASR